jgi:pimeloyl-ACP methyl ester carboxylesterase
MSEQQTIFILVNGINTPPGDPKDWNKRACSWVHLNTPFKAQCDEYWTTALTVPFRKWQRARVLADLIRQFRGWRVILIAHSNGAWVVVNALQLLKWTVPIAELHLVSGACDANFVRNGLNFGLVTYGIEFCAVYIAGKDMAMRIEDTIAGRSLFGITSKPLGLAGATNLDAKVASNPKRFQTIVKDDYGHSSWWLPDNFDSTMRMLVTK